MDQPISKKVNLTGYATESYVNAAVSAVTGGVGIGFFLQGNAYVANKLQQVLIPKACTISKVYAKVDTAPVGADLNIDINKNGTTIFTGTFGITDGASSANTTALDITTFAAGDVISIDITQIGSTTAGGNDLMVSLTLA